MLDIDTIRRLMADRNIRKVARRIGVHPNTLYRTIWGTSRPRYETIKKVSDYLEAEIKEFANG